MHNLRDLTVDIPTGVLTVVSGVAGSGKSTLIDRVLMEQHPGTVLIDQAAVGTNRRSNTATYTGALDTIRQRFAQTNKVSASLFSPNSDGACPECQGLGVIYVDLAFLEGFTTTCEQCQGRRFKQEVLAHRLRGATISDVLDMTAGEALGFFTERKLRPVLQALVDVGLDYLRLGQPLTTLSGGECQRLKLAKELHKQGTVYVLDEPTTGLHMSDVQHLLSMLDQLVDGGNTVVVIEHNLDVIKNADWVIDLGPEGGSGGGRIVFQGPPAALLEVTGSHTAEYLRRDLEWVNSVV
jgi:excinuclease ABC A subunit